MSPVFRSSLYKSPLILGRWIVVGMTLLAATVAVLVYAQRSGSLRQEIRQSRQRSCDAIGTRIEAELMVARQLTLSLAQLAPQHRGDRRASEELLLRLMRSAPKDLVYGMGLWYERKAFGDGTPLFGPYVHQSRDGRKLIELTYEWCSEDYNYPSQPWYRHGLHVGNGHGFTDPYFDTDDIYVSSVTSLFDDKGGLLGVATVGVTLDTIRRFFERLERDQDWAYLYTQDGRLLFHPRERELLEQARGAGRQVASLLDLRVGDLPSAEYRGTAAGQYGVTREVEGVAWTLCFIGQKDRVFAEEAQLLNALLGFLAGVLLLGGFVVGALWMMERRIKRDSQARQKLQAEVSERKRREQRLNRRHRLLESLIRRRTEEISRMSTNKDRLLSVLAHDMRGHFMVIRSLAQLLEQSAPGPESEAEQREACRHLSESTGLAIACFEDLLLWVRLQSNRVELHSAVIHWREVAGAVLPQLESQARLKGVRILVEQGENFAFLGDAGMVQTVLRNLGNNAIKFTPRDGAVYLRARRDPQDETSVLVEVEDTGVGMESEMASQIFSRRELASNLGTAGEKGTGLGLFICQEMCLRLKGRIWMRSSPGKGSVASFTLPLFRGDPKLGARN